MKDEEKSEPSDAANEEDVPGCWEDAHPPFFVNQQKFSDGGAFAYGRVRTTSWDFSGERTDLHDVFSLYFAGLLRSRCGASLRLIDVYNPAVYVFGELYGRELVVTQPIDFATGSSDRVRDWFKKNAAIASHRAQLMFGLFGSDEAPTPIYDEPVWSKDVRRAIGTKARETISTKRNYPEWEYLRFPRQGISVTKLTKMAGDWMRITLKGFDAQTADGPNAKVYRTEDIINAVSHSTLERLKRIVAAIEGACDEILIVPIESHVIALGNQTLVSIAEDCGAYAFEKEHAAVNAQREAQAAVFFSDARCVWSEKIDDARFQRLILELLVEEPGVQRVREVGHARDRDGGRDLMVDWEVGPERTRREVARGEPIVQTRTVLVQVKSRSDSINKNDVVDIRDTLEHYECSGFLLVAFPRITTPLFDHLTELRKRFWIEWWEQPQLEQLLRRRPDVAARFTDLVQLIR